jgi:hypothetical protein
MRFVCPSIGSLNRETLIRAERERERGLRWQRERKRERAEQRDVEERIEVCGLEERERESWTEKLGEDGVCDCRESEREGGGVG